MATRLSGSGFLSGLGSLITGTINTLRTLLYSYTTTGTPGTQGGSYYVTRSGSNGPGMVSLQFFGGQTAYTADGKTWSFGSNLGGDYYFDPIYFKDKFVSISNYYYGGVAYSLDGINWTTQGSPGINGINDYAYSSDIIVATNYYGETIYSLDGISWTVGSTIPGLGYVKIIYAQNKFVALDFTGRTAYSLDGINWTRNSPIESDITSFQYLKYLNNNFFAYSNYQAQIIKSSNGIDWSFVAKTKDEMNIVSYLNNKYIGLSENTGQTYYSLDGTTWSLGTNLSGKFNSVYYINDRYIALGYRSFEATTIAYSLDGISWTQVSDLPGPWFQGNKPFYVNGKYVLFSYYGDAAYSTDGFIWTYVSNYNVIGLGFNTSWDAAQYLNGLFISKSYLGQIIYSTDGVTWSLGTNLNNTFSYNQIQYANGKFVVVSSNGNTFYSSNGITWTAGANIGSGFWTSAAGNNKIVATSNSGMIKYSSDGGVNWNTAYDFGSSYDFSRIFYVNNIFIATTVWGNAAASIDGITWDTGTGVNQTWTNWSDIDYQNNKYIRLDSDGKLAYSTNGHDWTYTTSLKAFNTDNYGSVFTPPIYANNKYITTGRYGIFSSTDLETWSLIVKTRVNVIENMLYGGGNYVLVGSYGGQILYSSDGTNWHFGAYLTNVLPGIPTNDYFFSPNYINDKFVVFSYSTGQSGYSTDGVTWTSGNQVAGVSVFELFYVNNTYLGTTMQGKILRSEDGIMWYPAFDTGQFGGGYIYYLNGVYTLFNPNYGDSAYSPDSINWTRGLEVSGSGYWRKPGLGNVLTYKETQTVIGGQGEQGSYVETLDEVVLYQATSPVTLKKVSVTNSGNSTEYFTLKQYNANQFAEKSAMDLLLMSLDGVSTYPTSTVTSDNVGIGAGQTATYYLLDGSGANNGVAADATLNTYTTVMATAANVLTFTIYSA